MTPKRVGSLSRHPSREEELKDLKDKCQLLMAELDLADEAAIKQALGPADAALKAHVHKLNRYNGVKDIATKMVGLIAEQRQMAIKDVMAEMDAVGLK